MKNVMMASNQTGNNFSGKMPLEVSPRRGMSWVALVGLVLALLAGAVVRLNYAGDIEYKGDESYTFARTQKIGVSEPWPWLGMPSSSNVRNPGMSVWVFALPAKVFQVRTPPGLARIVQVCGILSLLVVIWIGVHAGEDAELWFWAAALAAVNPLTILLERKIWGQSILPLFGALFWMGWWFRRTRAGALLFGFIGACLGQIHMSGFFQSAGVAGWTALTARRSVRWGFWVVGSVLGAWMLVPWVVHVLTFHGSVPARGWRLDEAPGFKFIGVWTVDALGIDERWAIGGGAFRSLLKEPLLRGHATYLAAVLIVLLAGVGLWIWLKLIYALIWKREFRAKFLSAIAGRGSQTAFAIAVSFIGYGVLATILPIGFSRTYLLAAFPVVHLSFAKAAMSDQVTRNPRRGRALLSMVCIAQLLLSVMLFHFLHINGGTPGGPYGTAYHLQNR